MMLAEGFAEGYGCLSARADLLDRINVFPVADSDTGAYLRMNHYMFVLCCGQFSQFVLNKMVNGNLPDIVQQTAPTQIF